MEDRRFARLVQRVQHKISLLLNEREYLVEIKPTRVGIIKTVSI